MDYLTWDETVLAKFPAFDTRWDTPAMLAWFDAWLALWDRYVLQAPR